MTHSPNPTAMSREAEAAGYFDSLMQIVAWVREAQQIPKPDNSISIDDVDADEIEAAAYFIDRAATAHPATAGGKPGEGEIDHEFKSHPDVFWPAARGEKTFEFRKDDRGGYQVGQTVRLRCFADGAYTDDAPLDRVITNILRPGEFGLQDGYCILSLAAQTAASGAVETASVLEWCAGFVAGMIGECPEADATLTKQLSRIRAALARPVAEEPAAPVEGPLSTLHAMVQRKLARVKARKAAAPKANGVGTGGEGVREALENTKTQPVLKAPTWDEAVTLAQRAIYDTDGRGMIARNRNHLHERVAREIFNATRALAQSQGNDEGAVS